MADKKLTVAIWFKSLLGDFLRDTALGQQAVKHLGEGIQKTADTVSRSLNPALNLTRQALLGIGAAEGVFVALGVKALDAYTPVHKLRDELTLLYGSAAKGGALTDFIDDLADKTTASEAALGSYAKRLAAFNLTVAQTQRTLRVGAAVGEVHDDVGADGVLRFLTTLRESGSFQQRSATALGLSKRKLAELGIEFDKSGAQGPEGPLVTNSRKAFDTLLRYFEERYGAVIDGLPVRIDKAKHAFQQAIEDNLLKPIGAGLEKAIVDALNQGVEQLDRFKGEGRLKSSLTRGAQAAIQELQPVLVGGLDLLEKLVDNLEQHPDALAQVIHSTTEAGRELLPVVLSLTGVTGVVGLIKLFGGLIATLGGGAAGVIGTVVAGVGAVALFRDLRIELKALEDAMSQPGGIDNYHGKLRETYELGLNISTQLGKIADDISQAFGMQGGGGVLGLFNQALQGIRDTLAGMGYSFAATTPQQHVELVNGKLQLVSGAGSRPAPATPAAAAVTPTTQAFVGPMPQPPGSPRVTTGFIPDVQGPQLPVSGPQQRKGKSKLTAGQQQFAARLAAQTGLDPQVIEAWLLSEESDRFAKKREAAGNHNWLNIGYTDSGQRGTGNDFWQDPTTAADATAAWMKGDLKVPGFGRASKGIRGILGTAGQPAETQLSALQNSGWASSHYPGIFKLFGGLGKPGILGGNADYDPLIQKAMGNKWVERWAQGVQMLAGVGANAAVGPHEHDNPGVLSGITTKPFFSGLPQGVQQSTAGIAGAMPGSPEYFRALIAQVTGSAASPGEKQRFLAEDMAEAIKQAGLNIKDFAEVFGAQQQAEAAKAAQSLVDSLLAARDAAEERANADAAAHDELLAAQASLAKAYSDLAIITADAKGDTEQANALRAQPLLEAANRAHAALGEARRNGAGEATLVPLELAAVQADTALKEFALKVKEEAPKLFTALMQSVQTLLASITAKVQALPAGQIGPQMNGALQGMSLGSDIMAAGAGSPGSGGVTTDGVYDYKYCPSCKDGQGAIIGVHSAGVAAGDFHGAAAGSKAAPAAGGGKVQAGQGWQQQFAGVLQLATDMVAAFTARGIARIQAIGKALTDIAPQFGPVIGGLTGLWSAIAGMHKKPQTVEPAEGSSWPVHFSNNFSLGLGGNASSAGIAGRLVLAGAALAQPVVQNHLVINQHPGSIDQLLPEFARGIRTVTFNQTGGRR